MKTSIFKRSIAGMLAFAFLILGMMCGGAVSVVFMALCNAASAADQRLEELSRKRDSEPKEAGK